jgi:hypothetical protein
VTRYAGDGPPPRVLWPQREVRAEQWGEGRGMGAAIGPSLAQPGSPIRLGRCRDVGINADKVTVR